MKDMSFAAQQLLYDYLVESLNDFYTENVSFEKWCLSLNLGVYGEDVDDGDIRQYADFAIDFISTYEDTYEDLDSLIPSKKEERRNSIVQLLRNHLQDFDEFLDLMFLWTEAWSDEDKEAFICGIDYDSSEYSFIKSRVTKSRYTVMNGCDTYGSLDDESVLRDIGNWFATEEGLLEDWDDVMVRYFDTYAYGRDKHYEGYYEFVFLNKSNCWCYFEAWA